MIGASVRVPVIPVRGTLGMKFLVTIPSGGWLRTFDYQTSTFGDLVDLIATVMHDINRGVFDGYNVTLADDGSGLLNYDSDTANTSDLFATMADIANALSIPATTLWGGGNLMDPIDTFDPNTASTADAHAAVDSLIANLLNDGRIIIGGII